MKVTSPAVPLTPAGTTGAAGGMRVADLAEHVEHFRARVLQDALAEATAVYWRRRAQAFRDAMPRAGDYAGRATPDDLLDAWERCAAIAQACEAAATFALDADAAGESS